LKTTPVTKADLERSVIAVPPLARNADFTLNREANRRQIQHLESGGVRSLMYGGNANFYHIPLSEYAETIDSLGESVGHDTWLLPSVGPDYGKMIDQAAILKSRSFPTAMLLPMTFPFTDAGIVTGVRRFTDAFGKPAVVYIKAENYLKPESVATRIAEGRVASIKYAAVRANPADDPYLLSLIKVVDRKYIVSGIGERPAIVHLRDFGLTGFTSGSVCIAPKGSMKLLHALQAKDYAAAENIRAIYMPLEDCRDAMSPIRVLHEAVTLAGIADMGSMLPMLSNLDPVHHAAVKLAAVNLLAQNESFQDRYVA